MGSAYVTELQTNYTETFELKNFTDLDLAIGAVRSGDRKRDIRHFLSRIWEVMKKGKGGREVKGREEGRKGGNVKKERK